MQCDENHEQGKQGKSENRIGLDRLPKFFTQYPLYQRRIVTGGR